MKISYRADIDGLRSVAVVSVLLFHASVPGFSGGFVGVDVFFVISGYLITSILINELGATGRIDFLNFWARRTRRLVPSALLVVIVTLGAAHFLLPIPDFYYAARDSVWASTYLINWTKIQSAVEYFDEGGELGPFIHYWSLAVEEQFYIFLTVVFLIAIFFFRFFSGRKINYLLVWIFVTLLVFALGSFAINIHYSVASQPVAFFSTPSRIWQFVLGAFIGFFEYYGVSPTVRQRVCASWVGGGFIALAIFTFDAGLAYPNYYAILPTVGAGLVILAGINGNEKPKSRLQALLSERVPVLVGQLSYSLYLWHWPVVVLWRSNFETWAALDIAAVLAITFLLSVTGYVLVEKPVRYSRTLALRSTLSLTAGLLVSSFIVFGAIQIRDTIRTQNIIYLSNETSHPTEDIRNALPAVYLTDPACHVSPNVIEYPPCVFGHPTEDGSMFLFGDSHAAQWFPALDAIAQEQAFKLYSRTKSGCPPADVRLWYDLLKRDYSECSMWRERVVEEIERRKPAIVFISSFSGYDPLGEDDNVLHGEARLAALIAGERRTVDRIRQSGAQVVFLADTPFFDIDPLDCLVSNPERADLCRVSSSEALAERAPWSLETQSDQTGVHVVDMTDRFCWDGYCRAANTDFVFMRDNSHITMAYSEFLTADLKSRLVKALGDPFGPAVGMNALP